MNTYLVTVATDLGEEQDFLTQQPFGPYGIPFTLATMHPGWHVVEIVIKDTDKISTSDSKCETGFLFE